MRFDAIVFDLGNTLAPWREQEGLALYAEVKPLFEKALGPFPDFFERANRARERLIAQRENAGMREVTIDEFVDAVCGAPAPDGLAGAVKKTFREAFVRLCRFPEGLDPLLERLGRNRPLAVLSNFVLTEPIEEVLDRSGLRSRFVHVEVSATSGFMKPHPRPFEIVLEKLGTPPGRTLMVGDTFFADVVGGHRAGLLTALTQEFVQGPVSDPRAPGVRPNRILRRLDELDH